VNGVQMSMLSVPQHVKTSDDYYTPAWLFERMGLRFDLDVCAPPGGIPWIPADRHYTMADDGLASPWEGRVWMNPPYSDCAPWAAKFIAHRNGVSLTQMSKSKWCKSLCDSADGIVILGSLPFVGGAIFMPVFLAAFGDECVDAIGRVGPVRVLR
jgi:hypothetical protein